MASKRVIVELRYTPELERHATAGSAAAESTGIPGFTQDLSFAPVPLPALKGRLHSGNPRDTSALHALDDTLESRTYLVRGEMDDSTPVAEPSRTVVGVFADVVMEPMLICPRSPALGTHADVERLLGVPRMQRCGMTGSGVLLAIVDGGVNLAHLTAKGKTPTFDSARSFSTVPNVTPGSAPVGHGTMCAFDACIAAPKCTLLDIAVLQAFNGTASGFAALLSDIIRAYAHLQGVMAAPRRPGDSRSLVVSNSWGMFTDAWDFPVGDSRNYSDNPNHPFNRAVSALEAAGADILFAAGNCGADCPDGRCGGATANTIRGANSHPAVLTVAGVDITRARVGYSSIGPGRLTHNKPDICGYTHFAGSMVYAADAGTSAATPVVAGVVAALRTVRPLDSADPSTHPAAIRTLVTSGALDVGASGYDLATGFGVVSGYNLAKRECFFGPVSFCDRYPGLCGPRVVWDICKRYPWLCQGLIPPERLPPQPIPPLRIGPRPEPWLPRRFQDADVVEVAIPTDDLPEDIAAAYIQGVLHCRQLGVQAQEPLSHASGAKAGCDCGSQEG